MANFSEDVITDGDQFKYTVDQRHPLGFRVQTKDGRVFHYAQAGASDLIAGNLIQSAAPIANHLATTATATAAGLYQLTFTPGATAGAANLYAEGYLSVDTTPGNGYTYFVSGHGAITSSVAFTLTLLDPIQVALTTASRLGLVHNPYKNTIISATTVTAAVQGVAPAPITAAYYGWLQTWGACSTLINGTPGVGIGVVSGATTAGSVDVAAVAAEINVRILGRMMQVGVSTKNNLVYLSIAA